MNHPPPNRVERLFSEGTAIDRAIKEAVREAVFQHTLRGFPVAEWRDGRVVWVPPEEILSRLEKPK